MLKKKRKKKPAEPLDMAKVRSVVGVDPSLNTGCGVAWLSSVGEVAAGWLPKGYFGAELPSLPQCDVLVCENAHMGIPGERRNAESMATVRGAAIEKYRPCWVWTVMPAAWMTAYVGYSVVGMPGDERVERVAEIARERYGLGLDVPGDTTNAIALAELPSILSGVPLASMRVYAIVRKERYVAQYYSTT